MKSYKTHNIYHNKNTVYKDMQINKGRARAEDLGTNDISF